MVLHTDLISLVTLIWLKKSLSSIADFAQTLGYTVNPAV